MDSAGWAGYGGTGGTATTAYRRPTKTTGANGGKPLADFSTLLQSARNLNADARPRVSRSLKGIEKESTRLASAVQRPLPRSGGASAFGVSSSEQGQGYVSEMGVDLRSQQSLMADMTAEQLGTRRHPKSSAAATLGSGVTAAAAVAGAPSASQMTGPTIITNRGRGTSNVAFPAVSSVLKTMGYSIPKMSGVDGSGPSLSDLISSRGASGFGFASGMNASERKAGLDAHLRDQPVLDVDRFLHLQHEYIISSSIHEAQLRTQRAMNRRHHQRVAARWDAAKERILQHLGKASTMAPNGPGSLGSLAGLNASGAFGTGGGSVSVTSSFFDKHHHAPEKPSLLDASRTTELASERRRRGIAGARDSDGGSSEDSTARAFPDESVLFAHRPGGLRNSGRAADTAGSAAVASSAFRRADDPSIGTAGAGSSSVTASSISGSNSGKRKPKYKNFEYQFANITGELAKIKANSAAKSMILENAGIFERFSEMHGNLVEETEQERLSVGLDLTSDERDKFDALDDIWQCCAHMMRESPDCSSNLLKGLPDSDPRRHRINPSLLSSKVQLERFEFWKAYHTTDKRLRIGLQRFLTQGVLRFSEKQALRLMDEAVSMHHRTAMRGGGIGRESLLIAYVRMRTRNDEFSNFCEDYVGIPSPESSSSFASPSSSSSMSSTLERLPIWPLVYFALRVGDFHSAAKFARLQQLKGHFVSMAIESIHAQLCDLEFGVDASGSSSSPLSSFDTHPSRGMSIVERYARSPLRLDDELWRALDMEYKKSRARAASHGSSDQLNGSLLGMNGDSFVDGSSAHGGLMDPYEMAVYWLLCKRFDNKHEYIEHIQIAFENFDDFLWYKLWTLYDDNNELPSWLDLAFGSPPPSGPAGYGHRPGSASSPSAAAATSGIDGGSAAVSNADGSTNTKKIDHLGRSSVGSVINDYAPSKLNEFQELIKQVSTEIDKNDCSLIYPLFLLSSLMFEVAVDYLMEDSPLECIHLGIGLRWYGLLRLVSDDVLISTSRVSNLEKFVCRYAKHMKLALPDYYFYYIYVLIDFNEEPYHHRVRRRKLSAAAAAADDVGRTTFDGDGTLDMSTMTTMMDDSALITQEIQSMQQHQSASLDITVKQEDLELEHYIKESPLFQSMIRELSEDLDLCHKLLGRIVITGIDGDKIDLNDEDDDDDDYYSVAATAVGREKGSHYFKVQLDGLVSRFCGEQMCRMILVKSAYLSKKKRGDNVHCIELLMIANRLNEACKEMIPIMSNYVSNDPMDHYKLQLMDLADQMIFLNAVNVRRFQRSRHSAATLSSSLLSLNNTHRLSRSEEMSVIKSDDYRSLRICIIFCRFFNSFHHGPRYYAEAMEIIEECQLLPLDLFRLQRSRLDVFEDHSDLMNDDEDNDDEDDGDGVAGSEAAMESAVRRQRRRRQRIDVCEAESKRALYLRNVKMIPSNVRRHLGLIVSTVMKIILFEMDSIKPDVKYATISSVMRAQRDGGGELATKLKDLRNQCSDLFHFYAQLCSDCLIDSSRLDTEINHLFRQSQD